MEMIDVYGKVYQGKKSIVMLESVDVSKSIYMIVGEMVGIRAHNPIRKYMQFMNAGKFQGSREVGDHIRDGEIAGEVDPFGVR